MSKGNTILVAVAHPDDELLGVGGTILKHAKEGDVVSVLILGDGELARETGTEKSVKERADQAMQAGKKLGVANVFLEKLPDNQFDSLPLLSIVKIVEKYVNKVQPSIMYTHHWADLNVDHKLTFQAVLTACRPQPGFCVKKILAFETPSSTEWEKKRGDTVFTPTEYNNITDYIEKKIDALKMYEKEMRGYPHPRSFEGMRVLAKYRGMSAGYEYAEAFEIVRNLRD